MWAHGPLRHPVAGSNVQVVYAGLQGLAEQPLGLVRCVRDEGRSAQDCNARIVAGSAEASSLHDRQRTKSAWNNRGSRRLTIVT